MTAAVRTSFWFHDRLRTAMCYACNGMFEEQCVAVILSEGDAPLGHLCPLCLRQVPAAISLLLEAQADRLRAMAHRIYFNAIERTPETRELDYLNQLRDQLRQSIQNSREIRTISQDLRQLWGQRRLLTEIFAKSLPVQEGELIREASRLDQVATKLAHLSAWTITVEDLMAVELRCMQARFPSLTAADLKRVVTDRYQELLDSA